MIMQITRVVGADSTIKVLTLAATYYDKTVAREFAHCVEIRWKITGYPYQITRIIKCFVDAHINAHNVRIHAYASNVYDVSCRS